MLILRNEYAQHTAPDKVFAPSHYTQSRSGNRRLNLDSPCPRCNGTEGKIQTGTGPHAAKLECSRCGRFTKWISKNELRILIKAQSPPGNGRLVPPCPSCDEASRRELGKTEFTEFSDTIKKGVGAHPTESGNSRNCPRCRWQYPLIRGKTLHCKACGFKGRGNPEFPETNAIAREGGEV
jgi:ssDNA-binding Zn-finger/Zn-ribbon topoisomerase 1